MNSAREDKRQEMNERMKFTWLALASVLSVCACCAADFLIRRVYANE